MINPLIVSFPLSPSLRKLVGTRSLMRSLAKPAGLFCSPHVIGCIYSEALVPRAPRQHPSVFPPCLSSTAFSASCALAHPSLRGLSCIELCSGPPALLPHAHARGFSGDQLADDSQVLPTAHLSFLSHRRVYPAASSAPSLDAPN